VGAILGLTGSGGTTGLASAGDNALARPRVTASPGVR
jgi:hypothetical protein